MNVEKNDILTLSDNVKYLVVSKVMYEDFEYLYLVDIIDNFNMKFVKYENNELLKIENKNLNYIMKLFMNDLKNELSSK